MAIFDKEKYGQVESGESKKKYYCQKSHGLWVLNKKLKWPINNSLALYEFALCFATLI